MTSFLKRAACTAYAPALLMLFTSLAHAQPGVTDGVVPVGAGASVTRRVTTVELRATDPSVTYQIRSGEGHTRGRTFDVYSPICVAPCQATLPIGPSRLALSVDGSSPVEPSVPVNIEEPSRLEAKHTSNAHLRYIGWGVLFSGVILGTVLMVTARTTEQTCVAANFCSEAPTIDKAQFGAGVAASAIGTIVGLILALQRDSAEIAVIPLRVGSSALGARREGAAQALDGAGLGVRLRF